MRVGTWLVEEIYLPKIHRAMSKLCIKLTESQRRKSGRLKQMDNPRHKVSSYVK